jgi:hypothetical protein
MPSDRKIFTDEAPGWLWRAIQARRADALVDGDRHFLMMGNQDLGAAVTHRPGPDGNCLDLAHVVVGAGPAPWPCRQATILLRRYRHDMGWRPHWDNLIEGDG